MIGIPLGLALSNASEWFVHRYVLHGMAMKKDSFWSFHWKDHHRNCRKNDNRDPDYDRPLLDAWNGQSKEALMLILSGAAYIPLLPVAPFFVGTVWYCTANYYVKHKRSHQDVEWGRKHMPWHYDHHMGPDQHSNWCVTRPWFDWLMGTREPYLGTERERRDSDRRQARQARKAAAAG